MARSPLHCPIPVSMTLAALLLTLAAGAARADEGPTYHRDVAPIVQERCQECHRPGAIGPFALQTVDDAVDWAPMIEEVVRLRRMPPWHAEPGVGEFLNERRLPDAERQTILDWIAADCPPGDPADAPAPVTWPDPKGWRIGEPDAVLAMPEAFRVPAHGVLEYQYVQVPTDFGEDKWVRAMEVQVGAPQVVHHVLVFVIYPERSQSPRVRGGLEGFFASALPGDAVRAFPDGAAKLLPRGSTLVFQLHYTPDGEREHLDLTRLGLRFAEADEPVTRRVRTVALYSTRFAIPPGAKGHEVRARYRFTEDALLVGLLPHMHLRGESFRYLLRTPDGEAAPLLSVPRWDFNWQNLYRMKRPIFVPKGSVALGVATFDNSADNPANPDPTTTVRFGEQTSDEMMIGYLEVLEPTQADRDAHREGRPIVLDGSKRESPQGSPR